MTMLLLGGARLAVANPTGLGPGPSAVVRAAGPLPAAAVPAQRPPEATARTPRPR